MKSVIVSNGKKTYYIDGKKFFNDKTSHNGRKKAEEYCLNKLLDTKNIIEFDSELECKRYEYLLEKQKQGLISDLNHHLKIQLLPSFENYNGDTIPPITYNVDLTYIENGNHVYEDVKGYSLQTDTRFEVLKSLFDYKFREKAYIKIVIYREKERKERHIGEKKKPSKLIKKQSSQIKALKKELHDKEIAENKKKRDLVRLKTLREKEKLTSTERRRLEELEAKYNG